MVVLNEHRFLSRSERSKLPRTASEDIVFFVVFSLHLEKKNAARRSVQTTARLGGGELGHRLGTFRHGVLGELTRQDETNRGLNLAGRHRRLLVVSRELGGFGGDLFEDVVDERVHDGHRLGGDAGVRVDLLEHLVDVDLVGFRLGLAANLLGAGRLLLRGLLGHCVCTRVKE